MLTEIQAPIICEFDNSYSRLPGHFFARLMPTTVTSPNLIKLNFGLAKSLGIDPEGLSAEEWATIFSGNRVPPGADPIALAYAGHQFGHFVPQLGDGRAILIGEVKDAGGNLRDIQLKGSGLTPFSRQGDGRAALGPVLREYLVSEAMHALGVPTTRALAAVTTGEPVYRETVLPGAVLTRVASSHVRVGTFQYFAARGDYDAVKQLADYVIDRHYPNLKNMEYPYSSLLKAVTNRQAKLVAQWMRIGFIHGVMNTDNTSISGETIDFGPCAFMDKYDPDTVFSSIDNFGRYAYSNQPQIAQWNLMQLAQTLLPIINPTSKRAAEIARDIIKEFPELYKDYWLEYMRRKIGLLSSETKDLKLVQTLLDLMHQDGTDFTVTFRGLCDEALDGNGISNVRNLFRNSNLFDNWAKDWHSRLYRESVPPSISSDLMRRNNPTFIPRNHLVENSLTAAIEEDDFEPFEKLFNVLMTPYSQPNGHSEFTKPPEPSDQIYQTFCGT